MMDAIQTITDLLGLTLATVAGWYVIGAVYKDDRREATFLKRLFLASLALRVAVAVGTFALLPYGYFAPDEAGYASTATALMNGGQLNLTLFLGGEGWQYFNLLLFHIAGTNLLLP